MSNGGDSSRPNNVLCGMQKIFWPVYGHENRKVVPLALMMFCILFNYNILRDVKDALVVNAAGSEAISFLKLFGTLPAAIIFMSVYMALTHAFQKEKVFYFIVSFLLLFFALFAFVLNPHRDALNMDPERIKELQDDFPRFRFAIAAMGHWVYALFYIFAELWGTFCVSVLFWTIANDITKISEAKRFYPLFPMVGNLGLVLAGSVLMYATAQNKHLDPMDAWEINLKYITVALIAAGICMLFLLRWVDVGVKSDPQLYDPSESAAAKKKKKEKMGFFRGLAVLFTSRYLALIAVLVLSYGVTLSLIDATWKNQLKLLTKGDNNLYTSWMGLLTICTGIFTICVVTIYNTFLSKKSWLTSAVITPVVVLITGSLFFMFIMFKNEMSSVAATCGMTTLAMAVWLGLVQNFVTKGAKYAFFDPTKERSYIPLSNDLKVKGKAAVDGVGGRLGKSGGSAIQQGLFALIVGSTQISILPYVIVVLVVIAFLWLSAVHKLDTRLKTLEAKAEAEKESGQSA